MRPGRLSRQHDTAMLNVSALSRVGCSCVETQCGAGDVVGGAGHRDRGLALQLALVGTGEPAEILQPNELGLQLVGVGHHRAHARCLNVVVDSGHPVDRLATHRIRGAHVFPVDDEHCRARRQHPGPAGAAWSDEQPAVTPINSIAAVATQTPFSTAGIYRRAPATALSSSRDRSYLQFLSHLHNANMSATSSVAGPQELLLQLLDPANRANPYAVYQQFRDLGPMQVPDGNLTVFSSLPRL